MDNLERWYASILEERNTLIGDLRSLRKKLTDQYHELEYLRFQLYVLSILSLFAVGAMIAVLLF